MKQDAKQRIDTVLYLLAVAACIFIIVVCTFVIAVYVIVPALHVGK